MIDARRGQAFAAVHDRRGRSFVSPFVASPEEASGAISVLDLLFPMAGGDGAVRFRQELEAAGCLVAPAQDPVHRVAARHLCALGRGGGRRPPERDRAAYLRAPDAKDGLKESADDAKPSSSGSGALIYTDLPHVIAIERRSFPAPWSLAMFVLELSKPSGICLARRRRRELVGYLVCSRYDNVWHLMNVAIDPDHRRTGIAPRLIERLLDEAGPARATRSRCGSPTPRRSRCTSASASAAPGCAAATTTTTTRTP